MSKDYEATVMRIAGNILAGTLSWPDLQAIGTHGKLDQYMVTGAVLIARAIVAEVQASPPTGARS